MNTKGIIETFRSRNNRDTASVSTAKIAVWYIVGNVFAKGVSMLSTPIFTRLMSKEEYGQLLLQSYEHQSLSCWCWYWTIN